MSDLAALLRRELLLLWRQPQRTLLFFVPAALVPLAALAVTNYAATGQLKPAYAEFGGPWYEYEGSHWRRPLPGEVRTGIDWAHLKESRGEYVFHMLLGHHGVFSLSPVWLLAVAGMFWALARWRVAARDVFGPQPGAGGEDPRGPPASEEEPTDRPERAELVLVAGLAPLLRPYPADGMALFAVAARVNNPRHDDPDCVRPLAG